MDAYTLIKRKRDGESLSAAEITWLISAYLKGEIPDYQIAAWLMAVYFQGLTRQELTALTQSMMTSGEVLHLDKIPGPKLDKHSTGGVGDKTTLVLVPLVAAAGVPVVKLAGRGLGHTGGTIDKLEAIPGLKTNLDSLQIFTQVEKIGLAIARQTATIAPADQKLYALRDVTATVESIPLIASSIMSKKLAGGADALVLDVKVGNGAFMKTETQARELAETMLSIGRSLGKSVTAVLSEMNQPLGFSIGNALEVQEAIATLKGQGPADLTELCLVLGSEMLLLAKAAPDPVKARQRLEQALTSGAGLAKLAALITAQGGDAAVIEEPARLPHAPLVLTLTCPQSGYLTAIATEHLGLLARQLGAGRAKLTDRIDPAVGLVLQHKLGDYVQAGEPLVQIHASSKALGEAVLAEAAKAFIIKAEPFTPGPTVLEIIR